MPQVISPGLTPGTYADGNALANEINRAQTAEKANSDALSGLNGSMSKVGKTGQYGDILSLPDVYTKTQTNSAIDARITAIINMAPAALDTFGEIAAQLLNDETALSSLVNTVGTKANQTALDTEKNDRIAAVSTANTNIANLSTALAAKANGLDLTNEISNRQNADSALGIIISGKEPAIPLGTSAQYLAGDKTLKTLNAAAIGLQKDILTLDANGLVTWIYPIAYPVGVVPNIKMDIVAPSGATVQYSVQMDGDPTNTTAKFRAFKAQANAITVVLGLLTLYTPANGAKVHVSAVV